MKLPVASARLASWSGAYLAGLVAPDDLATHAVAVGEVHRVTGVDPSDDAADGGPLSLPAAVASLRAHGAARFWTAWPAPGDVAALPGPAETNRLVLAAGQAVIVEFDGPRGSGLALVPSRLGSSGVLWTALPAEAPARATTAIAGAERALKEAIREATEELDVLDVARTRPEQAARLAALRDAPPAVELPRGFDGRARSVLDSAQRLALLIELASGDDGAAVNRLEADERSRVLRELGRVVRHAFTASVNALAEDTVRAR